ncbi:MAG: hypothetical protein GY841_12555 [FCB group bacterium]|nr:hypothetical protein [FCB group bacterium]
MENIECLPPYPMWEKAVEAIIGQFETESYDMVVEHEDLKKLMGIKQAKTIDDAKKEQLDYMSGIERTKEELLTEYNLYLHPVVGKGYQVLHPNEQVRKGAEYHFRKSQKALSRSMNTLANVDADLLDSEGKELQFSKLHRIAFIKAAFRKRKLPAPEKKKEISS